MPRRTYISHFRRDEQGHIVARKLDPAFEPAPGYNLECRACGHTFPVFTGDLIQVGRIYQQTRTCPNCEVLEIQISDVDLWIETPKTRIGAPRP